MKVAVLGATGPSGIQLVEEALGRGYDVKALVRSPEKLTIQHDKLQIEKVDILDDKVLTEHFKGVDAVMSCLGSRPSFLGRTPITFYTESIKPMITAMRAANIKRLVCMTAWSTLPQPGSPWFIEWILRPLILGNTLKNMAEMEEYLDKECSDIDYTVVRPGGLTNLPSSGQEILTEENGYFVPNIRGRISRRDVTKFMLDCLEKNQFIKKPVAIAIKP